MTWRPIGRPLVHSRPIIDVAISRNGRRFLTVTDDYRARLWEIPEPPTDPWDLEKWIDAGSGLTIDRGGGVTQLDHATWLERPAELERNWHPATSPH
jgi:hypothetical protein